MKKLCLLEVALFDLPETYILVKYSHRIGGNPERRFLNNFCFRLPKSTFSIAKIDIMGIENV